MWIVYGEESGELKEFRTKREAVSFVRDCKRFDKENGLDGENWLIYQE